MLYWAMKKKMEVEKEERKITLKTMQEKIAHDLF